MGVKVHFGYCNEERVFPHARDWFVTDERVLQIYQEHDGDPEFVVMEYNRDAWEGVEWEPPFPSPQPEDEVPYLATDGKIDRYEEENGQ
jgi:hypothetical protein